MGGVWLYRLGVNDAKRYGVFELRTPKAAALLAKAIPAVPREMTAR
jgi:hypothetical protein